MSRNYENKKPKIDKKAMLHCPVVNCNRKYKTERSLQKHVESIHYFETRNANHFTFSVQQKVQLLNLAIQYAGALETANPLNLLPQLYGQPVDEVTRNHITTAQKSFAKRIRNKGILERTNWSAALDDFESFLRMGLPYYDTNFCPTLPIDFLWHSAMQDFEFYKSICEASIREIMTHCGKERSREEDKLRFAYFTEVFQHKMKRALHVPGATAPVSLQEAIAAEERKIQEAIAAEERKIQEQKARWEQYEREKAAQHQEMAYFTQQTGIAVNNWFIYQQDYLYPFKKGCSVPEIMQHAERSSTRRYKNIDSTC